MALDLVMKNIIREKDGRLTLHYKLVEDSDGRLLFDDTVQGQSADEIEANLRPKLQAAITKYTNQRQLEIAAEAKMASLKIELGLPLEI